MSPIILGWGNYYRHSVAKRAFNDLDDYIWQCTWNWARSKHPTTYSHKKVAITYFRRDKGRWQFSGKKTDTKMAMLSDISIRRFAKVRKEERVYDVEANEYWTKREYLKAKNSIFESTVCNMLFTRQNGKCPHCQQDITERQVKSSEIHQHHMKPRSEGGDWKLDNLRLLHAECHNSLHSMYSRKEMAGYTDRGIDYLRLMKPAK